MTVFKLFKSSLFRFKELEQARRISFIKIIGYLVLLSAFLAIPITFHLSKTLTKIQTDGQAIAEKIPDFTIQNDRLTPDRPTKGFIYQTDSIIFTFDPEGKRSAEDISTDMIGNFLSIGLLKDELVVVLPSSGLASELFGDSQLVLPYQDDTLQSLNDTQIRNVLQQNRLPWWLYGLAFIIALYSMFLELILTVLITTIGATIFSKLRRLPLRFFENLKIVTFAVTLPVIIAAVLSFFTTFDSSTFIMLGGLFIYIQMVRSNTRPQK
ncbi:DUF1189 domain-containing protein [Enterococcus mediterraneensis]|uniref:DUF1189 domain-containing protein n=1 Tax=Enterococcus mediterraneensis TaxID=2364791 RepID=UPI000F047831|nr:DUF1189 domain-containing protein [Enterococcus mediterraneensis]